MADLIGREILNYRIEQQLGQGGMGSVYLARNKDINQKVAIKVLNENLSGSVVIRKRFRDEAQLLSSLDHPNIVKFLNFREESDGVFLIMEYIDGNTLDDFINKKNGLVVEKRAYGMFDQILSAFAYAHKKMVIHRDIKPANIVLTSDNEGNFTPKILDFGIATVISESSETEKGWVVGTPSYMSPEQVLGENVDIRSDIYSLGVLLHQMLTGCAPYDITTLTELEINNKVVTDPLPRMKEFYPYISDKMQKIVDKATAKEAGLRFQTCNDFRHELQKTLNPEPVKKSIKIAAVALVLLLLGGGLFLADYYRAKTYYYKDYVEQWGVPQGIHRLYGSEFKHREMSYRFMYQKGKLKTLALVNSSGNILSTGNIRTADTIVAFDLESEWFDRPLNAEFNYRANGNIDYVIYFDRNGKALLRKNYDEGNDGKINQIIFRYNDEYGVEKKLPKDMTGYVKLEDESAERGLISRFALSFDEKGFIQTIHYRNENQSVGDGEHIYGKKYERDEKGRVIREYLLGYDDNTRSTSWGLGIKHFEYDAEDSWVKATYLAPDGSPSYHIKDGVSVLVMEYDPKYGNLVYKWFQNSDGDLVIPTNKGVAGFKYEYDNEGHKVVFFHLGTDKNPMYHVISGYIGEQFEYDKHGYLIKRTYIDENGQPSIKNNGTAFVAFKNDDNGNSLETQYFNSENQPCELPDGYSKMIREYDHIGNLKSEFFYDAKGELTLSKNTERKGWKAQYNEQNKLIKLENYGDEKQPAANNKGIIITKFDYDVRGNRSKMSFFDVDGETLKLNNDGIAGFKFEFDNSNNQTKYEHFDEKGNITEGYLKYAKAEFVYDDMGNKIETTLYEKVGNLINGTNFLYDERGNLLESIMLGKDKKPAQDKFIERHKYDERDNCIETAWYDYNNNYARNKDGYVKKQYDYNEKNQQIEQRFYNTRGNLSVVDSLGYAKVKYEYDNRGNQTKISFFNESEKLIKAKIGYAVAMVEYDAMNRNIRETHFDAAGKPSKATDYSSESLFGYDKWGNINLIVMADGFGNKINSPQTGYATLRREFDIRGNVLSSSYYDKDDKPCIDKANSVHKVAMAYDKWNRITEIRYYDITNKPYIHKENNAHKIETKYGIHGNVLEKRYYDASAALRKDMHAIEKYKYDERRRLIEYAVYDYLDRPVNEVGYHRYVHTYDESGFEYRKHYTLNGDLTSELKKDPNTKKWIRMDTWREHWESARKRLPINLSDSTILTDISIDGNTCTITLRLNYSRYDLSEPDIQALEEDGKSKAEFCRNDYEMPKNTTLVVVGVDDAERELYRISR